MHETILHALHKYCILFIIIVPIYIVAYTVHSVYNAYILHIPACVGDEWSVGVRSTKPNLV